MQDTISCRLHACVLPYLYAMVIGFDAKRAFHNGTGLGNYSRTLLRALAEKYPEHSYHLYNPKPGQLFPEGHQPPFCTHQPNSFPFNRLGAIWRRYQIAGLLQQHQIDLYHGLSNELPGGRFPKHLKKVVTVHDLIFERYPETYHLDERIVHRMKVQQACRTADRILATSQQTSNDLQQLYRVPEKKIAVVYQTCDPVFFEPISPENLHLMQQKYQLPERYFLFVSSITQRKNLITVCKALVQIPADRRIPLLVVGTGKAEKKAALQLMKEAASESFLIFLNDLHGRIADEELAAIYQLATASVYPSLFEGFGIPVLESMACGTPVICSNSSSLPEVGGSAVVYCDPLDSSAWAAAMQRMNEDEGYRKQLTEAGKKRSGLFTRTRFGDEVMKHYQDILNH